MSETPTSNDPGEEKRRSVRMLHAVPIVVTGIDALGQTFRESTATVMVSCTGCKYRSTHYVPKNSQLTVEINRRNAPNAPRIMKARVVWVQRPSNYRDQFHIAVEFEVPGNVWGIAVPPESWFPHPEDIELEIPVTEPVDLGSFRAGERPSQTSTPYSGSFTSSIETLERPAPGLGERGSLPHLTAVTTMVADKPQPAGNAEKIVLAMPRKEALAASVAAETGVQHAVKEILAKELQVFRTQIAVEMREALSEATRTHFTDASAAAINEMREQSGKGVAAVAEQAQKTLQEITGKLDEKIKAALEAAIAANPAPLQASKPRTPRKSSKRKTKAETLPEA
jgi:hypothetical protein